MKRLGNFGVGGLVAMVHGYRKSVRMTCFLQKLTRFFQILSVINGILKARKSFGNKRVGGAARPTNSFIPEGYAGFQDVVYYREDLEKARQLLKEAGFPDGFSISMDHGDQTPNPEIAQALQNSLARVGIKVKLNKLISAQLWPKYRAQKHELILARWGPDYVDPHTNAQPFADYKAKQLCWRNVYYNDDTSQLIQQAGQEMDNDKRIALYQEANKIIQTEGPYAMLYQSMYEHAVLSNIGEVFAAPSFDLWKLYPITKK